MVSVRSERELAAIAVQLAGSRSDFSAAESELVRHVRHEVSPRLVAQLRGEIRAGCDPLGDIFASIRSPMERRKTGAIYTPTSIVDSMMNWAASQCDPTRVVDPGAGSGRYLVAAADRFPKAHLIGVELDPLAALMLRANVTALGLAPRVQVVVGDYRQVDLPRIKGRTLFIGNPPYVRHHDIPDVWKSWFADTAKRAGIGASKLAGLHIHFFFRTFELSRAGDIGTFITSAEWLDTNYGSALRSLLADKLGGYALHVLDAVAMPFADAITTGAITCFKVGRRPASLRVRGVPSLENLNGLSSGRAVPWAEVAQSRRWSTIIKRVQKPPSDFVELGELCRVSRGQVTGKNEVWIAGDHAKGLPEQVLVPTVTKARELLAAGDALVAADHLRRVVNLPVDLEELGSEYKPAVRRFLDWAKRRGAADSYVAKHRKAWWSVLLYEPAPIICTYMARRPPAFVRNLCNARHLNIAHGLYPRVALDARSEKGLLAYLRKSVTTASGRTYAGGLTKFEPGEVERLHVPAPGVLAEYAA